MSTSAEYVSPVIPAVHRLPGFAPDDPAGLVPGRLLGEASSRRDTHNHAGPFDPAGPRCSACRWFEVKIFRVVDEPAEWLVYTAGFSVVPGETTRPKVQHTTSAFDVVELLTVRNSREGTIMPRPNARALAQAAGHDERVQDAYLNRVGV